MNASHVGGEGDPSIQPRAYLIPNHWLLPVTSLSTRNLQVFPPAYNKPSYEVLFVPSCCLLKRSPALRSPCTIASPKIPVSHSPSPPSLTRIARRHAAAITHSFNLPILNIATSYSHHHRLRLHSHNRRGEAHTSRHKWRPRLRRRTIPTGHLPHTGSLRPTATTLLSSTPSGGTMCATSMPGPWATRACCSSSASFGRGRLWCRL